MTLNLIDSHCHLQDEDFDGDREAVYDRTIKEGVGVIVPGYTMASSEKAVEFSVAHNHAWALVGIHPHDAQTRQSTDLDQLAAWVQSQPKVVGIGEIGLDYHYNNSPPEAQRVVFREQLALAKQLGVPASVHTREAEEDTLAIIREVGHHRGVIHCFTGTAEFAQAVLALGWHISFSGAITFKSAHALRQVVETVPLDRILIETDSPYLSPVPWRGQRNEPLRVIRVAEVVAAQKNCLTKQVFDVTLSNTYSLFFVSP
ncbi:MAG: TatD family hydrolase [Firmicutes bacterium]|nr:TatD family hydrolase [Bacillota bacterium]